MSSLFAKVSLYKNRLQTAYFVPCKRKGTFAMNMALYQVKYKCVIYNGPRHIVTFTPKK